ncbi:ATP-binding cassette domain-containing protein [Facklamia sp. DSM 111018]|uniref:ATP-binding cassette domain-containing protein n=1 Tax=Facklamia lactis TaxID=2749967 RepID=A0ABS0LSK7_9LACT|nr:ATP-binding cassette domain-containing protein [Facklamia lactis]MBG9981141.1 ATP-binding cassette domain-containing protein [Facklamia lactis]MBG9986942.1 ATP-binding cassette domain-containing protein [Facklamia lactis]
MAEIILKNVSKIFDGGDHAVKDVTLTIPDKSFTVLVGPSGSGKSTLLRMIAGLEEVTEGEIIVDGEVVNDISARNRDIAMVFQNYALYPSMTVRENIEFGLKNNKVPKEERNKLIKDVSEIVDLVTHLDKKPSQLSGGQRQRVALARAMVKKPKVFILDEPLSNLDAKLRVQMRAQLIELHKQLGTTFVYVTHDQVEAMSMGTHIILLNFGEVQQFSSPHEIYHQPENMFTATFMGTPPMNIVNINSLNQDQQEGLLSNDQVTFIGFRPEVARISQENNPQEGYLTLAGKLVASEMLGSETVHTLDIPNHRITVKDFYNEMPQEEELWIHIPIHKINYFDQDHQRLKGVDDHA